MGRFEEAGQAALEQQIRRFCETYYTELRQRIAQYPAASEVFPYYLIGFRRIVATLTKDGIVIVHWLAEQDSFDFRVSHDQRVTDITEDLAMVYPSGHKAVFSPVIAMIPRKTSTGRLR